MCDERTASKMSSFSTAKRNGLSGLNIIRMTQLQQYWTRGIGQSDSKYTHTAHLSLPKSKSQPTSIALPAPTLDDLLNPAPTNNNDTYEASFFEEDDDSDDEDAPPVTVVRSGNVERLEIDKFINLAEPKLIARFDPPSNSAPAQKAPTTQPQPKPTQEEWSVANSDWATKPFSF